MPHSPEEVKRILSEALREAIEKNDIQASAGVTLYGPGSPSPRVRADVQLHTSHPDQDGKTVDDCRTRFGHQGAVSFGGYPFSHADRSGDFPGSRVGGQLAGDNALSATVPRDYHEVPALDLRVLDAIVDELKYQDEKFGVDKQQSLPGYLLVMRNELAEAEAGWTKDLEGRHSALAEIVQCVAVGYRALATYGTTGCPRATNDETAEDAEARRAQESQHGVDMAAFAHGVACRTAWRKTEPDNA